VDDVGTAPSLRARDDDDIDDRDGFCIDDRMVSGCDRIGMDVYTSFVEWLGIRVVAAAAAADVRLRPGSLLCRLRIKYFSTAAS
jgi:hypothetical protein